MLTRHRRTTAIACLLFCTQAILFSKFGLGQVGIAWDPSYAATHYTEYGCNACGGGALGLSALRGERYNPLQFDSVEPNDEQRRVLFEFYNANRSQAYSADGIEGWDTSCGLNPLRNAARQRQSNRNLASCLGAGTMHVDPFLKRVYGQPTATHPQFQPETILSPLPATPATQPEVTLPSLTLPTPSLPSPTLPTPTLPNLTPNETWMPTNPLEINSVDDLTEETEAEPIEEFPFPEEYEDVAPEFEWDESLLDDLPELNHGLHPSALPGNPLPPSSTDIDGHGKVLRQTQPQRLAAKSRPILSPRRTRTAPSEINPLQAAIQLQSQEKRRPANALEAAIAIEAKK